MDYVFLINQCLKLDYSQKMEIEAKIDETKANAILRQNGCLLIKKDDGKYILLKTTKPLSIYDPNVEVRDIIDSKESIPEKLKKLKKIVKTYSLSQESADKLKKFLDKIEPILNEKLKKEVKEIKSMIKIQTNALA